MFKKDYVVDVDDPHGAPSSDPKTVYDLELDVGAHDQYESCYKTVQCTLVIGPLPGLNKHKKTSK